MLKQDQVNRSQMYFFCVEESVPKEHLLRKIDGAVDFSYTYELVENLYSTDNGRPSCDPVVLFKKVLIQHSSLHRTVEEIKMNVTYRCFLGYTMTDSIPHFATISYNFKHRFTEETIRSVFRWTLAVFSKRENIKKFAYEAHNTLQRRTKIIQIYYDMK